MDNFSIDAYTPAEIAKRIEQASIAKTKAQFQKVLALAILAGIFIALGATLFIYVTHQAVSSIVLLKLVGSICFCLGLILVVVAGAELFTGNNLLVIAYVDHKITLKQLLLNWSVVYIGNFIGALILVVLLFFSKHWLTHDGAVGIHLVKVATNKLSYTFIQAFTLGILCNLLVCLAVWLCFACHSVTDKILAIIFPITAFVVLGFEHSVANMNLIPAAIFALEQLGQADVSSINTELIAEHLTWSNFLLSNLLPVTLGNIVGGGLFVGLTYWFIYIRSN
ncbi:MAG: formate/nitrite family transporter [Kangiellaceae bacterium]|nr:formate/nitrite family transporter [Kangiellaceae bacterium]MCW9001051.1 formate/nitrite family transporter [Kangiellaceae bacterium]